MKREMKKTNFAQLSRTVFLLSLVFLACFASVGAQTTAFTYQGRLTDASVAQPTSGTYQMQFALYDSGGVIVGTAITVASVQVVNGIFTVNLDFGAAAFAANAERLLEIRVFNAATAAYVSLSPRQPLTSAPLAIRALNATTADVSTNTLNVGGTPAAQIIKEGDTRLSDTRTPTAGSANYIQNQNTAAQTSTNFRIDGTGAANVFNAATQFDIGGTRVLSNGGTANLFAGVGAGGFNTGSANSFFGAGAGERNTTGAGNAFFGTDTGFFNTTGTGNAFFGASAGVNNSTGISNSFFGFRTGQNNSSGIGNSFVGVDAGNNNRTGNNNSFVGASTGQGNSQGDGNSFFGAGAGLGNTTGDSNTIIGYFANVGANNLKYAAAFGAGAIVGANDTIVLGKVAGTYNSVARPADTVIIPGNLNVVGSSTFSGTLGANIFNAATQFNIGGSRVFSVVSETSNNTFIGLRTGVANTSGAANLFVGETAGLSNTAGSSNSFVGVEAGRFNLTGNSNSFFGWNAGRRNTTGEFNTFVGIRAGFNNTTSGSNSFFGVNAGSENTTGGSNSFFGINVGSNNTTGSNNTLIGTNANVGATDLTFATALGAGAIVRTSNTIVLGRESGQDLVRIFRLGSGGITQLCLSAINEISTCSSSLRYKTNIAPFNFGLNLVKRLNPITFDWKTGGLPDLGLGAEDVAAIEPLLVTYNKDGQIEGVKYDRIGVVLLNAVKEQQTQIEVQQKQLAEQKLLIDGLKTLVCGQNPTAAVCQ